MRGDWVNDFPFSAFTEKWELIFLVYSQDGNHLTILNGSQEFKGNDDCQLSLFPWAQVPWHSTEQGVKH